MPLFNDRVAKQCSAVSNDRGASWQYSDAAVQGLPPGQYQALHRSYNMVKHTIAHVCKFSSLCMNILAATDCCLHSEAC
jgi:hypothetical protein